MLGLSCLLLQDMELGYEILSYLSVYDRTIVPGLYSRTVCSAVSRTVVEYGIPSINIEAQACPRAAGRTPQDLEARLICYAIEERSAGWHVRALRPLPVAAPPPIHRHPILASHLTRLPYFLGIH